MSTAKNKLESIRKMLFADAPAPAPAPVPTSADAPTQGTDMQMVSYPVDGGDPVYVNISDDGVANIDANDAVYSDEAMTMPYPDGSYKVTGTDFGFTVAGGMVASVTDPDNKGAGKPMGDSGDAPAAQDMNKEFKAEFDIMKTDFNSLKEAFGNHSQEFAAMKSDYADAKIMLAKQAEAVQGLLAIVESLANNPVADVPSKNNHFKADKEESKSKKDERLQRFAQVIKSKVTE